MRLVNNDDLVRAGTGFSTHPHQDMEIVTWVLAGELEHKDSTGCGAGVSSRARLWRCPTPTWPTCSSPGAQ